MNTPKRIQRRRVKGWRMPENTKSVTRPGKWGNPFKVISGSVSHTPEGCVQMFRLLVTSWVGHEEQLNHNYNYDYAHYVLLPRILSGLNLACYCPLCEKHKDGRPWNEPCEDCPPCHADVLLELANGG